MSSQIWVVSETDNDNDKSVTAAKSWTSLKKYMPEIASFQGYFN